jgi:hypothetical protein
MVRQVKSKVKNMLIIFFDIKGIVHKEFVLAGQTVNTIVTFYVDCMEMCEDFTPKFGDKVTGCCITTHHLTLPFSQRNFDQNEHDCCPHPPYFSVSLMIEPKGCQFVRIEVIEAELQAVLNTHDFQDAFKQLQKCHIFHFLYH